MFRRFISPLLIVMLLLGAAAVAATIPAGERITVRIGSELNSGKASAGQQFEGTLARDLSVHGRVIAKAGDRVLGKVTYVKPSGRLHKPGFLTLRLTSVNGIPVHTSAVSREGNSHTKSNATKIGGLVGGGKGALIGAGAGGAAGTGVAAATGKKEAVIPAESMLSFTTTSASK
jgi:hypothetical protein